MSRRHFGGGRWRLVGATTVLTCAICAFIVAAAANGANTLTVCDSGCGYTSIQAAIYAASSGDTISVAAGTHRENGVYDSDPTKSPDTNKSNLTIVGAGNANDATPTIIDASAACSNPCYSHTYGLYFEGVDRITLKNFELLGPTASGPQQGYGLKLEGDTNVTVDNVTIVGSRRSNIDLNGVSGATFTNVTSTGTVNGNGMGISDSNHVSINGITTSGNSWGGIALYANGSSVYPCGVDTVSVANATLGETAALYTGIDHATSTNGGTCTITNLTVPTSALPYKVLLNGPEGALGDPQDIYVTSLANATTAANQTSTTAKLLYSTADGSSWVTSGFTVQDAVNAATAGGTIHVAAGTYPQDVTVSKALTLDGAQAGVDARTRSGSESTVKSISVSAGNVAVDGFSFNGTGSQVAVSSTSSILSGVSVRNNVFSGYHSVGLPTSNAGNIAISQNVFKNATTSSEAMQIKASTTAGGCNGSTVQNNTFNAATNNGGSDVNFSCTGSHSSNVTVTGNSSTGLSGSSSFTAFSGVDTGISVTNNVATSDGSSVFFFGNVSGTASITGNTLTSTGGSAVSIHGGDVGTSDVPNTGAFTISNNVLSGAGSGVAIAAGTLTGSAALHGNDLSGSATGVTNHSAITVNATGNWWGSNVGPGSVSGVTTSSWCLDSACVHLHDETPAAPPVTTTTAAPAPVAPAAPTPNAPQSAPATGSTSGSVTVAVAPVVSPSTGSGTTTPAAPVTIATSWSPTTFSTPVTVTVTPQPIQATATGGTGTGTAAGQPPRHRHRSQAASRSVTRSCRSRSPTTPPASRSRSLPHRSSSTSRRCQPDKCPPTATTAPPGRRSPSSHLPTCPPASPTATSSTPTAASTSTPHHATLYGLLLDTQAPSAAKTKVIVQKTGIRLSWAGAKDNVKIDHYVISRNGHGYISTKRTVAVLTKPGTYLIRALDTAGNKSAASLKVTVTRTGNAKHPFSVRLAS